MFAGSSPKRDESPLPPPQPAPANPRKRKQAVHNASTPDLAGTAPADGAKPDTHAVLSSRHALANRPRLSISRHPILTPFADIDGHVYNSTDCPAYNHLGFRYIPAGISPPGSILPCTTIESAPTHFRVSWEDRSQAIKVTQDGLGLLGDKGYRSARCNAPLREGKWYMEVKIDCGGGTKPPGSTRHQGAHVRLGWGRREAPINAPVGLDGYSYAVRDLTGDKVHLSRPRPYGRPFGTGDVIGMYISLPPRRKPDPKDPMDPAHIKRERIAIEVKGQEYFESLEYAVSKEMMALMDGKTSANTTADADPNASSNPTSSIPSNHPTSPSKKSATVKNLPSHPGSKSKAPSATPGPSSKQTQPPPLRPLPTLGPSSRIAFFVNGECQGTAFQDLLSYLPLKPHQEKGKKKREKDREREREGGPKVHWENTFDDGTTGYYPMISLFNDARVRINPGPNFDFEPPPDIDALLTGAGDGKCGRLKWRPVCERYAEFMQEQWELDKLEEEAAKLEWERRQMEPEQTDRDRAADKKPPKKKAKTAAAGTKKKKAERGGSAMVDTKERGSSVAADTKDRGSSVFIERGERGSSVVESESVSVPATPRPGSAMDVEDDRFAPSPFTAFPTFPPSMNADSMLPASSSFPSMGTMPSASSYNGIGLGLPALAKREEEEEEEETIPLMGPGMPYGQPPRHRTTTIWAQKEEEEELPRSSPPTY